MTCGTNLSGIGKGMLIYSNDYDDKLPRAGADYNAWVDSLGGHGNAHGWQADDRRIAYAIDPKSGRGAVTTSASLYLLVKYAEVDPKYFICKGEKEMQEFRVKDWLLRGQRKELTELWDFGYFVNEKKNQTRHVSYSYHHPFGNSALTVDHEPGMAIAADRSPWCNSILDRDQRWSGFKPDLDPNTGTAEQERTGNSLAHHGEGQNVLFLDSHVAFKKRPFVGIANDNIYTVQDSDDPNSFLRGRMPVPYDAEASQPRSRRDSVLLQENGKGR
jgi:prepilin-type processing-associated H-X9-DG protein